MAHKTLPNQNHKISDFINLFLHLFLVYFRSSSGKSHKIEKKTLPTTIFPPPKIGLKS